MTARAAVAVPVGEAAPTGAATTALTVHAVVLTGSGSASVGSELDKELLPVGSRGCLPWMLPLSLAMPWPLRRLAQAVVAARQGRPPRMLQGCVPGTTLRLRSLRRARRPLCCHGACAPSGTPQLLSGDQ